MNVELDNFVAHAGAQLAELAKTTLRDANRAIMAWRRENGLGSPQIKREMRALTLEEVENWAEMLDPEPDEESATPEPPGTEPQAATAAPQAAASARPATGPASPEPSPS